MSARQTEYRGWVIEYDPKPIPVSCGVDWSYCHKDYDGPEEAIIYFANRLARPPGRWYDARPRGRVPIRGSVDDA